MLYLSDDALGAVNNEFLGFRGVTFPWRARHVAYGIFAVVALVTFGIVHRLGVPWNLYTVICTLTLTVLATRWIGTKISYETPVGALIVQFWHELTAPRTPKPQTATFDTSKIRRPRLKVASHVDVVPVGELPGSVALLDLEDPPTTPIGPLVCNWCAQSFIHTLCSPDTCSCSKCWGHR